MIKLSILIAHMPNRRDLLLKVMNVLNPQTFDESKTFDGDHTWTILSPIENIEIKMDQSLDYNIGVKRNKLLQLAKGDYVVFIDDDDMISHDYVSKILAATETNPDCIGISGTITFNGGNRKQWHISKEYGHWYEKNNIYYRTPNHISPVKRELALQAGFPEISFGEDAEYSSRLLPLLKTEVIIPGDLYEYRYVKK